MVDIGSDKWAQSVSLPDADMDAPAKEHLLQDIPTRIAQQMISLGEDLPNLKRSSGQGSVCLCCIQSWNEDSCSVT